MSISRDKVSYLIYVPAIASLIPFIGIPFGISATLWGISDWKIGGKKAVFLSCAGFLVTFFIGLYFYFGVDQFKNSSSFTETKVRYSQAGLAHLVRYIEYYKLGHGYYPNSLTELKEQDNYYMTPKTFSDPFTYSGVFYTVNQGEQPFFYTASVDENSYELFSVGPDKVPHTQDDIYPVVLDEYKPVLGLRTNP